MARLLRTQPASSGHSRLLAPQKINAATLAPQVAREITVSLADEARIGRERRFPLQSSSASGRVVGPRKPVVVTAATLAPENMRRLTVRLAVRDRLAVGRRYPPSGFDAAGPLLGPGKPQKITLPVFIAPAILKSVPVVRGTNDWRYRVLHGVSAPSVVAPPAGPTQQQQQIAVTCTAVQRARRPAGLIHSTLAKPAQILPTLLLSQQQIKVTLIDTRTDRTRVRYATHTRLLAPQTLSAPAAPTPGQMTPTVSRAGVARGGLLGRLGTHTRLIGPQVITPVGPPAALLPDYDITPQFIVLTS